MDPYRVPVARSKPIHMMPVRWVNEDAMSITITHSRGAGYLLSTLLGIFSAWLVTATVDAVKQTIAVHQPYRGQALVQGKP